MTGMVLRQPDQYPSTSKPADAKTTRAVLQVKQRMNALARRAAGLLLSTVCLPFAAFAADTQPTHEFILDNGLKVVVREDHRAPVVVSQIWYKVGSTYESPGQTGLSHALEHMMFKGSEKLGPAKPRAFCVTWAPKRTPLPATITPPITRCWPATACR